MALDILLTVVCSVFALVVVISSNPMVSAFALLTMFVTMAGIFFQLGSPFISAIQVLVYAGAIAILFIFVLMLLNIEDLKKHPSRSNVKPIIGIVAALILLGVFSLIITNNFDYLSTDKLPETNMMTLFNQLFQKYLVPFELATMLLLASVVAVVSMLKKSFRENEGEKN
ncbi:MAG: NADH-quinone oxidoreductase subunit J [Bacteriovoracaceae bacterium]